ncbi:MAG: glycosyltransferase family 2 protein [Patescibacteria group bacterium]
MKKLSIIIVTYNSSHFIKKCLRSIYDSLNNLDNEIIVIDNTSTDDTLNIVRQYKAVKIIENRENFGFAKAVNQGIRMSEGQIVLLLNPDTIVLNNAIEKAVDYLNQHKEIGILGCKIKNNDGTPQPSCGRFPVKILDLVIDRTPVLRWLDRYLYRSRSFYQKPQYPDWVVGSFFLFRRAIAEKISYFDERYFMYTEDVDFCYRAQREGYRVGYFPGAEIIHYDMGKTPERYPDKYINHRLSLLIFYQKFCTKEKLEKLKKILRQEVLLKRLSGKEYYQKYISEINQ